MSRVVITGAARGIGLATANLFRAEGWQVAGLDILEAPDVIHADVSDPTSVAAALAQIEATIGLPEAWVNNAGIILKASLLQTTDEQFDQTWRTNVGGVFHGIRAIAARWLALGEGGHIINVSSGHAIVGGTERAVYAMTKGAIEALTRNAANELSPHGILVNCVAPGFTLTEMSRGSLVGDRRAKVERRLPLRRVAEADEVARTILTLAEGRLPYFTGQVIRCDGGWTSSDVDYSQLRDPDAP